MGILTGVAGAVLALLAAALVGLGSAPFPYPGIGLKAQAVPAHVYPWKPSPLQGKYAANEKLKEATKHFEGKIHGSESLAFAPDGRIVMLDEYGNVFQAHPDSGTPGGYKLDPEPFLRLSVGRPLGAQYDMEGNLYICDTHKGLLVLPRGEKQAVLAATHVSSSSALYPGRQITFANDLDIAEDGTIYFTSSTPVLPPLSPKGYWDMARGWQLDLLGGSPQGLVLRYVPTTGEVTVVADGLRFANGIALSSDESHVIVAETNRLCLTRVWIKGPKAGMTETFIDRLPGPPDSLARTPDGGYVVALVATPPGPMQMSAIRSPALRAFTAWATTVVAMPVHFMGAVVKVDSNGDVVDFWADPQGSVISAVSSAYEHDGRLWMGNLIGSYIASLPLSATASS